MKSQWKLCWCLLTVGWICLGNTLFELLRDYRNSMTHYPGRLCIKSPTRTLLDGGGTDAELVLAFQGILQEEGFETRLVRGWMSMDSEQLSEWLPDIEIGLHLGMASISQMRWCVPSVWLQCKALYDDMLRGDCPTNDRWIDVFPGFIGSEILSGISMELNESTISNILKLIELEQLPSETGCLENMTPFCRRIREELSRILNRQSSMGGMPKKILGRRGAIRGYRSTQVQNLRPVEILEHEIVDELNVPDIFVEVLGNSGCILSHRWNMMDFPDGVVQIKWFDERDEDCGELVPEVGTWVMGWHLLAELTSANERCRSTEAILFGTDLTVRFRLVRGDEVIEQVTDSIRAGDTATYAISSGSLGKDDIQDDNWIIECTRELRRRLDRFGRLAAHCYGESPKEQLRVSKIALCPRGKMVGNVLSKVERLEMQAGACGVMVASRNLSLTMSLGQNAVAADFLHGVCSGWLESPLGLFSQEMEGSCDFIYGQFGDGRGGIMCADYPCWLDWMIPMGAYSGSWIDSDGEPHHIGIIRIADYKKIQGNDLEFQDTEWMTSLAMIRTAVSKGLWNRGNEAGELMQCSVFSELFQRSMNKCRLHNLMVEQRDGIQEDDGCFVEITFDAEGVDSWQVYVLDASGMAVWANEGTGNEALIKWDGCSVDGTRCNVGYYDVVLLLSSEEETIAEGRCFLWDDVKPEVNLHAVTSRQDDTVVIDVEYDVRDESSVVVQLQLMEPVHRTLLFETQSGKSMAKLFLPVPEGASDVCLVQVIASDVYGNVGSADTIVVLDSVFAGGSVWQPDIGDDDDKPVGKLRASLDSPLAGQVVQDVTLDVQGTVSADNKVKYQLRMRNGQGKLLECYVNHDREWYLSYMPSILPENELELLYPMRHLAVDNAELGRLDLNGMPNGKYTLELVAISGANYILKTVDFFLDAPLKLGCVVFAEKDGTLKLKGIDFEIWRRYSSLSNNGPLGYGWTMTMDSFEVELYDERVQRESLTGGKVSLRTGGSRDVTMTLPDGHRTTFAFSLVYAGGYSYTYNGSWNAPAGCEWTLRATVNSNVTALPGLEPYWNSAGLGVPLDYYDFPGFVLKGSDGTEYMFEREHLGEYEAAGDDGGEVMLDCYGNLILRQIHFPDGKCLRIDGDDVLLSEKDGDETDVLRRVRDESGRIIGIEFLDGSKSILEYVYSDIGNLIEVRQGKKGGTASPHRYYGYDDREHPHLLTKVVNAAGWTINTYAYDGQGRLVSVGNGIGGHETIEGDVFSRVEIHTDEHGNEKLYRYDEHGNVLEQVNPDGGILRFSYDVHGNMLFQEDALGRKTYWTYDENGRMLSRTAPNGGITYYSYDSMGNCNRMVEPNGRTLQRNVMQNGKMRELVLPSGNELVVSKDDGGRVRNMSCGKGTDISFDYENNDQRVIISDGNGQQIFQEAENRGNVVKNVFSWIDSSTGQVESASTEVTKDNDGRPLYISDSMGNWKEYVRDLDGKTVEERDNSGHWSKLKYNVQGICVESIDDRGFVTRNLFDSSGRVLIKAGPEQFSAEQLSSSAPLVFSRARLMEYDACGRVTTCRYMRGTVMDVRSLEGGYYECTIVDEGVEVNHDHWVYDKMGQVLQEEMGAGQIVSYGYDEMGKVIWSKDEDGCLTQFSRDSVGNVTSLVDACGARTQWRYDDYGCVAERRDADGRQCAYIRQRGGGVLKYSEDGVEPIVFERREDGTATKVSQGILCFELEHDLFGALVAIKDSNGNVSRREYDCFGRMTQSVSPVGRARTWEYDSILGEYVKYIGGNGSQVEVIRGADGKWSRRRVLQGESCIYEFERLDDDCFHVSRNGEVVLREDWKRDLFGRRVSHEMNGRVVECYVYDDDDRVVEYNSQLSHVIFTYEKGRECARKYTRCGGRELGSPLVVAFDYDPVGRPVQEWCSNGWQRNIGYDEVGRVNEVSIWDGDRKVYEGTYSFDDGGRKVALHETRLNNSAMVKSETFWKYDSLGNLIEERIHMEGQDEDEWLWQGGYDSLGNLCEEKQRKGGMEDVLHHEFDADGCIILTKCSGDKGSKEIRYQWDEVGQLVSESCTGCEQWKRFYHWSGDGRLDEVVYENDDNGFRDIITFQYDVNDNLCGHQVEEIRGSETSIVKYNFLHEQVIYDRCPQIMDYSVSNADGQVNAMTILRSSIPLGLADDSNVDWLPLGGHRQLAGRWNGQDHEVEAEFHDAWGNRLAGEMKTGPGVWGEWCEAHSGLVYLRGRFYCPRLRRFISQDPYLEKVDEPKSFNRYAYCMNDPVNRKDPQGTFGMLDVLMVGTGIGLNFNYPMYRFLSTYNDILALNSVGEMFEEQKRTKNNAVLYVHGMAWHEKGWSNDMQEMMKKAYHINNQDSFEFRWTGFSASSYSFLPIPARLNHLIGLWSLVDGFATVQLKGYINVSVISHSWGTVLSRDALFLSLYHTSIWATMGSPLGCFIPLFPFWFWNNYVNYGDPVVWAASTLFKMGYNVSPFPLLYQDFLVRQVKLTTFDNNHSVYWTSHTVIGDLARMLKVQ